ncbi:hypothetical protein, partial [Prosthecobacter sp.]|uniref:hypothetical protein n=1 Tax=Prosthecobacter sp. TaxID=1965333 RepID=UPI001D8C76C9
MKLELSAFLNAARHCAMQMMTNATYMKDHLHEVTLPGEVVPKIEVAFESLIGTKHDVMSAVLELADIMEERDPCDIPSERT